MFARKVLSLVLLSIGLFLFAACQAEEQMGIQADMNGASYRIISAVELQTMLDDKDFLLVTLTVTSEPA